MKDPLHDYLRKHKPVVHPALPNEYARICERVQEQKTRRQRRAWYYVSAATLAAAGMMAFLTFTPDKEWDGGLEPEDIFYQVETQERGAYYDWLLIADQVVVEAGDDKGPPL